jgi:transcriptional regulator with XRE-family HTH domain
LTRSELAASFGAALRRIRIKKGLSQQDLADKLPGDQSVKRLSELEHGRRSPTLWKMNELATALDVPITSLISEMERPRLKDEVGDARHARGGGPRPAAKRSTKSTPGV